MATRVEDLLDSALELSPQDRAQLVAELISSLDGEPEAGAEAAWLAEVDRRIVEASDGKVPLIEREDVTSEVRKAFRRT